MKKFRILMGATALTLVAATVIACHKEKAETTNLPKKITILKEDDMSAYLKQFKEKMLSSTKGVEALSMDDARWHLEAVLNYTYGEAGHPVSDIQCDTFYYTFHTDSDKVTLTQLSNAFDALSQNVEKAYRNCTLLDKSMLAIQTTFENESKNGDVVVRGVLTTGGLGANNYPLMFGSTDYWWEDDLEGKCGPYLGECRGEGAVQQLQSKINLNLPSTDCISGHGYYTDIVDINPNALDYPDPNSPSGYRIPFFYCNYEPCLTCLSPDDMNYYLIEALKLINELKPDGKVIINMTNQYGLYVPIGYHLAEHYYTFFYGAFHCNGFDQ